VLVLLDLLDFQLAVVVVAVVDIVLELEVALELEFVLEVVELVLEVVGGKNLVEKMKINSFFSCCFVFSM